MKPVPIVLAALLFSDCGPGLRLINVRLEMVNGTCDATEPMVNWSATLDKSDQQILLWRASNTCATSQRVRVCGGPPVVQCASDGTGAMPPNQFEIGDGKKGHLVCLVDWPNTAVKKYKATVVTGPAGTPPPCPMVEGFEITIEVVP